ncbi:MAG: hypothetical protein KDC18_09055, partial [Alphaproteobacteria bacterium]|nr:hypothetical protein [Alphaproteobacteria bacterium]
MAALLPDRASAALATAELDLGAPLAVAAAAIAGVEDQRNDDTVVATVIGSTVRVTATAPGAVTLESVTGALSDNTLSASASANAAEASTTLSVSPTTAEDTVALAILQRTTPTGGSTATSTGNRGQILVEGAAPAVDEVTVTGAVSADNNDVIATATGNVAAAKIAVAGGVSLAGTGLAATVALDQTLSALPDSTAGADLLIVAGQQAGAAVTAASSDDTVTVTLQSVGGATATLSDSDIVSLATGNANTANLSVIDGSPDTVGASAALSALGDQSGAVSATTANATIALNTGLDSAGNTTGNTGGSTLSVAANTQGATAHGSDSTQTLSVQANRLAGDATNASLSDGDTVADGIQLLATADLVVASTQIQRATVLADGSGNGIAANVADEDGMVSSATVSVTGNTQSASALGADTANTLSLTGNGVDATGAVAAVQSGQAPVSAVTGASTITLFAGSSVDGSTLTVSRNAQLSTATGARSTNTLALTDTATAITIADHAGGVSIGPNGTLPIVAAGYALANAQRNGDGADVTASTVDSIIRTTIAGDAGASTVSVSDNEVLATASGTETLNTATLAFRNAMINGAASLAVGASRQQQQGDVSSAVTGEAGTGLAILTAIDGSVSDSTIVTENNRLEATSIGNNALGNTVTIEASRIETTAAGGVSIEGAAEFNNLTPLDQTPSDVLLFEITSKPPGGVTYAVDIYYSDLGTTIAQGDPRNPFPFAIIIETDGTMYPSAKVGSGKYQVYATATDTQYGDYTPNDTFVPAALSSPFDLADTYVYEFAGQLRAVLPDVAAAAASGPYIPLYTAGTDADGNLAVSSFQYSANATTRARLTDDADAPTASATIKIGTVTAGSSLSDSTVMADQNTLRAAATTNNAINAETVTVATVMAAPVTLLNAQQASWGAAQAFIAVAGTGTPAVNAGGVVIQWEGPIDGSSLSVSQNATTGAAKTNVADNTIRVSANTLEHSIATDGAMVARSPNLSSQADISFLNWQLSGNDAQSTVFGSFAILQQNDPAVSGSGLAVIGNTQTALALGNGAQNTVTLEASAFASAGSALVSEQTSTGNATAGSDATVFASAAMSGSTLALNGNTNQSVAVANEALNAVTLTAANALPAQTVPTNGILNGGATVSADHVLASDQTVIGFGPGTAASATTTVYNGDTADATGGPIVRSTVAMNGNATLAQAGSNAATNSVALNADQSGATAVLDNTQSNSQPTAATTVVSVSLDQGTTAAITLLDVAIATVEGNSATADATGNSSTSTIAVTGTNVDAGLANTDATLDTSVGANADGAYLLGNTVANSGAVAADSSASGYGIALQTDLVGAANSTVRLSGNSSASSATANTTASALTIGGDGTANLDA